MVEYTANGLTLRWDVPDLVATAQQTARKTGCCRGPSHASFQRGQSNLHRERRRRPDRTRLPDTRCRPRWRGGIVRYRPAAAAGRRRSRVYANSVLLGPGSRPAPRPAYHFTPLMQTPASGSDHRRRVAGRTSVPAHTARFAFEPEFLFRVTAPIEPDANPVGETPEGLRMMFAIGRGGNVDGPALTGEILHRGGDWMRIRPDGVGIAAIDALIKPVDGGVVLTEYSGIVDFGPDGYRMLAAGGGPKRAPIRLAPRYLTAEPHLRWLNRLQCFAVGEVNLERYLVEYDLYAMRSRAPELS